MGRGLQIGGSLGGDWLAAPGTVPQLTLGVSRENQAGDPQLTQHTQARQAGH